jgi:hypothetical protein
MKENASTAASASTDDAGSSIRMAASSTPRAASA